VNEDELWHAGVDPNAETQRAWAAGPGASIPRQGKAPGQGGSREHESRAHEDELAATRLAAGPGFSTPAGAWSGAIPGRRRPSRRRLLFAAGGVMLLAGGGVATAAAMEGGGRRNPLASGTPGRSPSGAGAGSRTSGAGVGASSPAGAAGAGGAPHTSASAHSSSPAGSPSGPASGSASGSASGPGSASGSPSGPGGGKAATQPQWYVDDEGPMAIALTMDDGPSATYTPQVLEILQQHGVKATFNMIGSQVSANLSLVREVSAQGHTITNHTWNHADLSHLSVTQVLSQIDRCNDALANANQHPTIFRAPYGNWSPAVFEACAQRDLKPVGWSVDPRDWDTEHVSTQQIVQSVLAHTHAHDIILEHDGPSDRAHTVAALKIFVPALLERGFTFVAM
jgi:peptidoglycan/xylan/chitin deacetylase (PgdA/CDA1 family)